jgi:SM-20-related protein
LSTHLESNHEPVDWIDAACDGLVERGWFVQREAIGPAMVEVLIEDLGELAEDDRLKRAGVGREGDFQIAGAIRRDLIFWLRRQRPAEARFLDLAERLRLELNRRLFLALFEFEAHFALYPPGAFYRRHFDAFRGQANRIVSLVVYLNRDWQPGDGGELLLYDAEGRATERIEPRAGTLVLMMSEEIEHEVLETHRERASIAGWYRLNNSTADLIDPPR